ncbi:hypothetical protein MKW98_028578 [Papaver atlanticum]|uniref:Uncharacterized protein n=1 Tax=Papaver atlanticum TaxID=357466 RepID=A0AAD4XUF6_9MAGN|nr:hypothetical protein MKW98_028578 [Papaver atlanticum]
MNCLKFLTRFMFCMEPRYRLDILHFSDAIAYDNRDINGGHWGSRETIQTHGLNLLPHIFESVTYDDDNDNDNTTGRLSIISVMQIWRSLRSLYMDVILQLIDKAGDQQRSAGIRLTTNLNKFMGFETRDPFLIRQCDQKFGTNHLRLHFELKQIG